MPRKTSRIERVHHPHHRLVDPPATPSGDRAPGHADDERHQRRRPRHREGDAGADQGAREQVATDAVGAEQVAGGEGRGADGGPVDRVMAPGGEQRAGEGREQDQRDDGERSPHPRIRGSSQP
jgi:hypothetical protein